MRHRTLLPVLAVLAACATTSTLARPVPRPLPKASAPSAYEAATAVTLETRAAEERPGLHNVFHLSDDIVSGAEPEGEIALRELADMGIKTVLSVDGKAPDHETAAKYGLRYVHVPIRYNGIEEDELKAIAKTFRELEGPFYVHCFHGKHRGPAAAAVGRVLLDGVAREQAIAEMRQWCGTSGKYEGLYSTIAFGELPSAEETATHDFDFAPAHQLGGFRHAMIVLPRSWDVVEAMSKREWQPDPGHPDASAVNEARRVHEIFAATLVMDGVENEPDDFRGWLRASEEDSRRLAELLAVYSSGDAAAGEEAKAVAKRVKAHCTDCHAVYRD